LDERIRAPDAGYFQKTATKKSIGRYIRDNPDGHRQCRPFTKGLPMRAFSSRYAVFPLMQAVLAFMLIPLVSCTTEPTGVDADLKALVNVVVLDANTAAPMKDVRVDLLGHSNERTPSSGRVSFTGVRAGNYLVRLSKNGYEDSQEPLTVATAGTQDVAALTVSQTYRIHRKGASVKGRLLLRPLLGPDTTAVVAAQDVTVELRSTATGTGSGNTVYLAPVRVARTSASGHFSFDSLPEISGYVISVPEFSRNGRTYSLGTTNVASGTLLVGQEYSHPNITLNPATSGTFQVFARSLSLSSSTTFVLEFSAPVDTALLAASSIQLRTTVGTTTSNIASTRTWSGGLTVLSLVPATGTWNTGVTYSVMLTGVRDVNNRVLATTTITALPVP
jgi:hypothetical protein